MRRNTRPLLSAALLPLLLALAACAGPAPATPAVVPAPAAAVPGRITNADPAMEYRPETADGVAAAYTPEQITGAQRTLIRFLADETLGPGSGDPARWWEANRARFAPDYRAGAFAAARTRDGELLMPPLAGETLAGRTITVDQITGRPRAAITVGANFDATYRDRSGAVRQVHGTASGTVVADALTGAWLIEDFTARADPPPVSV